MNSDKPDQAMENNAITSKNKKKSKGKSKTDAAISDVIGRSPKKSFWKNLFRFKKHHDDPGNSSTHVITVELGANSEETKAAPNQRLSSIFEETADPATLDPKTIAEDISEIQKTIQRMSETSNPSVIIDKIAQNYPSTNTKIPKKRTKDDAFLGYLSDISSTSSEDDDDEESGDKLDEQPSQNSQVEYSGITNQDNNSTYTDLLADDKTNIKGSSSLLKEGYSFEYSETSENSNDCGLEEKPEKVTFDNKVETKDANSIIMVRPLDENESQVVIDEIVGSMMVEKNEFVMNTTIETTSQLEDLSDITEEDIIVARIQKIVNGQINSAKVAENFMLLKEEQTIDSTIDTIAATSNLESYSLPSVINQSSQQKQTNRTFFSIPPEDVKTEEVDSLGKDDGANREGDQNQLSNIPEEEEDDGIGSHGSHESSSSSTITVVANSMQLNGAIEENMDDNMQEFEDANNDPNLVPNVEVTDSSEILNNPDIMKNAEL